MNNINIFVSSTCYDLSQIRVDLSEFITNSGHNPILSEFENFPISPELNTIENCIKIVKENADILVLIVGNRYGNIINNGKSITNNEFLVARQKGIPIFCFIDKKTLNALSFWNTNKDGDFSSFVDNVQIFDFIEEIRNNSKIWTFPFEKAQDIISTLKVQLSYLFKKSLSIKNIFDKDVEDIFKLNISEKSLKILLDKSETHEYSFLAQILVDEIKKKEFLKNDIQYSILTEPKHFVSDFGEIPNWAQERLSTVMKIIEGVNNIISSALPKFLGEPGVPADLKGLYYVAVKYAELYEKILNWVIITKSTYIGKDFESIKHTLSGLITDSADAIWNFPFEVQKQIEDANQKLLLGEEENIKITLTLTLKIDEKALDNFNKTLDELNKYI
ncbi:DUF4062 domain-containing protein [Sphingobacterium gobiense]|uniref:DUF4062 domain-containing protein n=1 Tax=Sphingobacterium gobiense TaxID=1382456 RepID=A0A2S9JU09_9SPHI|nr:DUF4062 domain-containing protein [Sphingobacterium gobiense]PRD56744.1 hypothetical protein C5749_05815 [Sphingobacterium gobiense]